MKKEIGSEYWRQQGIEEVRGMNMESDNVANLISGRTALDFIIRDFQAKRTIYKALLPSYCCDSMIEPFIRNNIKVEFYRVDIDGVRYDFQNDCDAVVLMDYFGYEKGEIEKIAVKEKSAGKIVIYDSTHKLNGNFKVQEYADYSFCSYRKWFYCNYASVIKHMGKFFIEKPTQIQENYCILRNRAADMKTAYMTGVNIDKKRFLDLYAKAERVIETDYAGYKGIEVLFDEDGIIKVRRRNAEFLMEELKDIPAIRLWTGTLGENDVPLFFPIFLKAEMRNNLRKYLIEKKIYCPIHWPLSELHTIWDEEKSIYFEELSLICDQRYDIEDMEREIRAVKDFFREYRL